MTNERDRRLDPTGYVDPRLQRPSPGGQGGIPEYQPLPPQRMTMRPAPPNMALPQVDEHEIDEDEPEALARLAGNGAPSAPHVPRIPARPSVAAAAPAAAPVLADTGVIELSRTYTVHGEPLKRFTMRKPVAREIGKIGNPIKFDIDEFGVVVEVEARWDRVMKYVTALSEPQIPPSVVEEFDYADLDSCAAFLGPFFLKVMS
jgi:hypothetical protein